jgi:diadenosine tetraphosphate (Ap4A) HIT family hydrolase
MHLQHLPDIREAAMTDCLFCDRSRSHILTENGFWYVRYDNYPATPGHVEIVPNRHVESLFDLTLMEIADAFALLLEARELLDREYRPDSWNIGINDGKAAGQTIPHLHIHLIPRYHGDQDDPRGGIRRGLPNGDPDTGAAATSASVNNLGG